MRRITLEPHPDYPPPNVGDLILIGRFSEPFEDVPPGELLTGMPNAGSWVVDSVGSDGAAQLVELPPADWGVPR